MGKAWQENSKVIMDILMDISNPLMCTFRLERRKLYDA